MIRFGKLAVIGVVTLGLALPATAALAPRLHDPRTTAKKLGQSLEVDGAGKFVIDYKALHFNGENLERAKKAPKMLEYYNGEMWGKLGTANVGFDLAAGETKIAKGDYVFGINMTTTDDFSLVFTQGANKIVLPLKTEKTTSSVAYLTVTMMATDALDTFTLEARCGPFRGTIDVKVPYLDEKHDHPAGK